MTTARQREALAGVTTRALRHLLERPHKVDSGDVPRPKTKAPAPWLDPHADRPTIDKVIKQVCKQYKIKKADLMTNGIRGRAALARQYAMWRARHECQMTFKEIAKTFNLANHTVAMYAVQRVEDRMNR